MSSAADADNTKKGKHHHESALMAAAHILMRLTQGKSIEEIARYDFDDNMELVTVWTDYMIAVNWMYKDGGKNWIATDNGKKWIDKYYEIRNR